MLQHAKSFQLWRRHFGKNPHLDVVVRCPHSFGLKVYVVVIFFSSYVEFTTTLTEHQFQSHKAAHKVIKINGEVSNSVAGHQQLEDGIIQTKSYQKQKTDSEIL